MSESMVKLNPSQVRILQALGRNVSGLTRGMIEQKANVQLTTGPLGPVDSQKCKESDERNGYPSLHSLGYVTTELRPGRDSMRDQVYFVLTEKGKEALGKYATRKRPKEENKIPREALVPVVLAFRKLRTYGYELYTEADIAEIRAGLPEDVRERFAKVGWKEVIQQICNLRKIGALKQEREDTFPEWYADYREGEWFAALEKEAAKMWGFRCSVNADHEDELKIVHRHFNSIGEESVTDVVVLCKACRDRSRKSLAVVPDECPNPEMDE